MVHRSKQIAAAMFALLFTTISVAASKGAELKEVHDDKYKPGQVWSYRTRANEQESTLTILRVDETPDKKRIVHIRVDHVQLTNCKGGQAPDTFEHMPFSREALNEGVLKVIRTGPVPDFRSGYSEWRAGWDAGKAGYYTISVALALDVAQKTFDQGVGCSN
ncbi:MAG TPA: hypothetical protein VFT65_14105 [Candidatus Angelobacter sp.]|nr:hypothetical protein [Candidatus Angelobacter sp.]